jgi:hypothetical protein
MFFGPKGYAELVFLALWLEFADHLFSDEILGIFNHSSNIKVWSDQLSIVIYKSVDVLYVAPQAHGIINVALHKEYSPGIVFIFSQERKDLYHV